MSEPFEVFAIRYGTRTTKRSELFYRYHVYGEDDAPIGIDYYFWVLRRGEQAILLDTGFERGAGERRGRSVLVDPLDALAELGIEPQQVSDIIVSHCHYDHIGNVFRFPSATLHIDRRELEFWTSPLARRAQFAEPSEPSEIDHLQRRAEQGGVRLIEGGGQVAPGVRVRTVGGHCPGQLVTTVDSPGGWLVLASDALHLYEEMERDMPFAIFSDLAATYEAYEVLRGLERDGAAVVAGHDPAVMTRFGKNGSPGAHSLRLG